ncbi:bile acid-CoA:amino acid N-acyltransferase-like isoform X3 [Macrobrachium nipponense]|uniref:bile acid-CoA:amino acid N-acyltransferase-like isoform X3 n=1 Tax=Macrobrachium nipponense TaxID=159736 RepID=UPI0030C85DD5
MISNALTCVVQMRLRTTARLLAKKYRLNPTGRRGLATTVHLGNKHIQSRDVWVEASPRVCLHDVHTELKAGGLKPNSPVTLRADLIDEHGKHFSSNAHYIADNNGGVDLEKAASVGGSYQGVFPAGLLSTLSTLPTEKKYHRLFRRNPLIPWKITVSVHDGHADLSAEPETTLASVELERHLTAPGVQRIEVRHGRVRGSLYLPPGPGPFPGVIDLFGFIGGLFEFRSATLASKGIASLALAVFNYDDLPVTPKKVHFEYFEEAIQFLMSQPQVIPDRCGVVCNSKSGDIGYNMAVLFEEVKAVIGINALTFPFYSQYYYGGKLLIKGKVFSRDELVTDNDGLTHFKLQKYFNNATNEQLIPVEEADEDTQFMVVCGDDDPCEFKHSIPAFEERMQKANKTNYETVLYKGAGHLLHSPYDPLCYATLQPSLPILEDKEFQSVTFKWGGTPLGTCEAQVDLWQRMQAFFKRHVRDKSSWYQAYLQCSSSHTK